MEEVMGKSESKWCIDVTYEEAKNFIDSNVKSMARSFIAVGYYLKHIRDRELYREDGYGSIWEFAQDRYGISRSTASRWMAMNDRFSVDGNSPNLAERYSEFEKIQLQEMLSLPDDLVEEVTPDMTVREIRGLGKVDPGEDDHIPGQMDIQDFPDVLPEPEESETSSVKLKPYERHGCITGWSRYPEFCSCCGHDGVECCSQCDDDSCNSRCGWIDNPYVPEEDHLEEPKVCATSHTESDSDPVPEKDDHENMDIDNVVDTDVDIVVDADEVHEAEQDIGHATPWQTQARNSLSNLNIAMKHKAWRAALSAADHLVHYLGLILKMEQPDLPILKNNGQRKAFLDSFHDWPVWFLVPHADETYYRYDLPDGSSIVICEYKQWIDWKEKYIDEDPDVLCTREYLLKPGYHYLADCRSSRSLLIEHLKEMQKGEKDSGKTR